ncbi:MAG TPA: methionine--tRNA ligase [Streptosporangiaceae bacterium]
MHSYITTTIPYVNARPHIGFALELVQADVLARHRRARGDNVRFQAGTDDNSLKNVLAAEAAGQEVQKFVTTNGLAFLELGPALTLSVDDVIRTSSDPRHRPGVEKLWRACADSGDLYLKQYEGLYCTGCEQFYSPAELPDGRCPEHLTEPELVAEENWFFRLSRYEDQLRTAISSGRLRIEPAGRRNEVLALIDAGLEDFSASRPAARARGWGLPVPGDPSQVIYVWWDALGNYVTALGYGSDPAAYHQWWTGDGQRLHLLGKGVLRFHAVYWPAMLLSAGLPLPTGIFVHDYLTAGGRKISKSAGAAVPGPAELAATYGADAVRWWLLREVPRVGDADFTVERMIARADDELANGIGNLVNRVVAMIHRYRDGRVPGGGQPLTSCRDVAKRVDAALAGFDFRAATEAVWTVADQANRYVNEVRPWELARRPDLARQLDAVLHTLHATCVVLAAELAPFLPGAAARLAAQLRPVDGVLPSATPVFRRLRDTVVG